jgi:hypothetical protein
LAVSSIIQPPDPVQTLWECVPPDLPAIEDYLAPVKDWLTEQAGCGDFLLVQGDFGATYLMVRYAFDRGLIPVYSTTERQVFEDRLPDGRVKAMHAFSHRRFRKYGC